MDEIISNPNILGGTPCFAGTRVPVDAFFDHLRRGYTIDYFIAQFPTVTRAQAQVVLDVTNPSSPRVDHQSQRDVSET